MYGSRTIRAAMVGGGAVRSKKQSWKKGQAMFIHGRAIGGFLIALTLMISGGCKGGTPQDGEPTAMDADAANSTRPSAKVELAALMTQVAVQKRQLAALRKELDQAKRENNDLNKKLRAAGSKGTAGERVHELSAQLEKSRAENLRLKGLAKNLNLAQREIAALRGRARAHQAKARKALDILRRATVSP